MIYFKRFSTIGSLTVALLWVTSLLFAHQTSKATELTGIQNLQADEQGVSFEFFTPDYELASDGALHSAVLTAAFEEPGTPQLPYYTAVVAVPPGVTTQVKVTEAAVVTQSDAFVRPVGRPALIIDEALSTAENPFYVGVDSSQISYEPNPAIYNTDALFPANSYTVSPVQYARDLRFVEITLYPLRYNPQTQQLRHTAEFSVEVQFVGEINTATRPLPAVNNSIARNVAQVALNQEFVAQWQGVSTAQLDTQAEIKLPVGKTAYKIAVSEAGIYAVTYAQLTAAGLTGKPALNTIQMMHDGAAVAYQTLDKNSNNLFDGNDEIRFYGWPFDGTRYEKFYVTDNIFWLWFNGTAATISSQTAAPSGDIVSATTAELNFATDRVFINPTIPGLAAWAALDNEPDYFMWYRTYPNTFEGTMFDYFTTTIDIPYPVNSAGGNAQFTVELQSRADYRTPSQNVSMMVDIAGTAVNTQMGARDNINVVAQVPLSSLVNGANQIEIHGGKEARDDKSTFVLLNEMRVKYLRHLTAEGNHLTFHSSQTGAKQFHLNGFTETNPAQMLIWDVSNRLQPINLTGFSTEGGDGFKFGRNLSGNNDFAIAAVDNLKTGTVSAYDVTNINPSNNKADWLAVSDALFMGQAQRLAAHRAQRGMSTHVVDFEDIVNQYGYGFPTPYSINAYLTAAFAQWSTPPSYLLLMGDADVNPRQITDCACDAGGDSDFTHLNPHQIPTYMSFHDRFEGLSPSDFPYTLIIGNDEVPDLAVGRITAETVAQAAAAVDKTIQYESNLLTPEEWQSHMLFVYDDTDTGGNFYDSIVLDTLPHIPEALLETVVGLENGGGAEVQNLRNIIFDIIGAGQLSSYPQKVSLLNWRGHGAVNYWGASGNGSVLKSADAIEGNNLPPSPFNNFDRPLVSLSFDCLDGHFAYPGWTALSEALMQLDEGRGSAAHWSSSGLGFDFEHTKLSQGFYTGLFDLGYTAIGDAVNYAKIYSLPLIHDSEIYSFILQGDPALQLYQPELNINIDAPTNLISKNSQVKVDLTAANTAVYPSEVTVTYTVPATLQYVTHTAARPITHTQTIVGAQAVNVFTFGQPVSYNDNETIHITFKATANGVHGTTKAVITGTGMDISPNTGRIVTAVIGQNTAGGKYKVFLPVLTK